MWKQFCSICMQQIIAGKVGNIPSVFWSGQSQGWTFLIVHFRTWSVGWSHWRQPAQILVEEKVCSCSPVSPVLGEVSWETWAHKAGVGLWYEAVHETSFVSLHKEKAKCILEHMTHGLFITGQSNKFLDIFGKQMLHEKAQVARKCLILLIV